MPRQTLHVMRAQETEKQYTDRRNSVHFVSDDRVVCSRVIRPDCNWYKTQKLVVKTLPHHSNLGIHAISRGGFSPSISRP